MPKDRVSDMQEIAKRELESRGYVFRLSTAREGENLVGRVQVSDAATNRTVAKFVGIGKFDNLELVFGIDAAEGISRDILSQIMGLADMLKFLIPGASVRQE
ncbi:MAG TPA: hypothetical protein VJ326_09190 [Thermoplasmata archaeon]|jgi:hypothetical protein|nr:hypothetical protein [Thermoplasmata archaeon]